MAEVSWLANSLQKADVTRHGIGSLVTWSLDELRRMVAGLPNKEKRCAAWKEQSSRLRLRTASSPFNHPTNDSKGDERQ